MAMFPLACLVLVHLTSCATGLRVGKGHRIAPRFGSSPLIIAEAPAAKVAVTLDKPLEALRFEAGVPGALSGICIGEIIEGGSASNRPAISKGAGVFQVAGQDCTQKDLGEFLQLLEMLSESPVKLVISAPLPITSSCSCCESPIPAAPAAPAKQKLEGSAKVEAAFAKNFGTTEATQKMATKVTKTVLNQATWKNPIYFWSIAGTAVLFVPIILYSVSK